jgi:hypothetical protein
MVAPSDHAIGGPPRASAQESAMDLFEYALRAYNLLLDLVLLILSPFLGPLRYVAAIVLILALGLGGLAYMLARKRRRP